MDKWTAKIQNWDQSKFCLQFILCNFGQEIFPIEVRKVQGYSECDDSREMGWIYLSL